MTRGEAKKLVCKATAKMIDPRQGHDFEWYGVGDMSAEDQERVREAAISLAQELAARGRAKHAMA